MSWRTALGLRTEPVGEVSALRVEGSDVIDVATFAPYRLNSTRVDYELARDLYANTADNYKLGAWPAKPVVNTLAGFVGAPVLRSENEIAQAALDEGPNKWQGRFVRAVRNAARDGDCFARIRKRPDPLRPGQSINRLEMQLIPADWVDPTINHFTGGLQQVVIKWPIERVMRDSTGRVRDRQTYTLVEVLTAGGRELIPDPRMPVEMRAEIIAMGGDRTNDLGFVPIVHVRNDAEEHMSFGQSELEPIEPFMRAYHDLMLFSLQGGQMAARPKVKIKLSDVKKFQEDNFTPEEIRARRFRFRDKELFFLRRDQGGAEGDDIEFISTTYGLEGATSLLEYLFACIVDISETPEFVFGTAIASSRASAETQMPIFGRRIERKREEFRDPFMEVGDMYLAATRRISLAVDDGRVDSVGWDEITTESETDIAQTVSTLISAIGQAIEDGTMSYKAGVEFLRQYVPTMEPYDSEVQRIGQGRALLRQLETQGAA